MLNKLQFVLNQKGCFLINTALTTSHEVVDFLNQLPEVIRCSTTGEVRRKVEVLSQIEIVVSTLEPKKTQNHLTKASMIENIISQSHTEMLCQNRLGIPILLYFVDEKEYATFLFHKTASNKHLKQLSNYLSTLDLTLTADRLSHNDSELSCSDEKTIFEHLKLDVIPPELREGTGEIESAFHSQLPSLIEIKDIRGLLHNHTTWSDGKATIEEMAITAKNLGCQYIGISDHSQAAFYAGGLNEYQLHKQFEEIDQLNQQNIGIQILKGTEVDILADGSLDFPDSILSKCDFVIASIHSQIDMAENHMTNRIITAMKNPYVSMIGHPTGRILLGRPGHQLNMDIFFEVAKQENKLVELNANPHRLDLHWRHLKTAKEIGIKISINPDAHTPEGLSDFVYGVTTARRGWITPENCVNTLPLDKLMQELKP